MSILSSGDFIAATTEYADQCFSHVEQKLGLAAITMARDEDELALAVLLNLDDTAYNQWRAMDSDNADINYRPTTAEEVSDAELEYINSLLDTVGRVDEYGIVGVEHDRIEIMKLADSDTDHLTRIVIVATLQEQGAVTLKKQRQTITFSPRSADMTELSVTPDDFETAEALFARLRTALQKQ